jgi:hypothetical protein
MTRYCKIYEPPEENRVADARGILMGVASAAVGFLILGALWFVSGVLWTFVEWSK